MGVVRNVDLTFKIAIFGRCGCVEIEKSLIDISENECRDVAMLRLYKGFRYSRLRFNRIHVET
jgi:hypothetical protein